MRRRERYTHRHGFHKVMKAVDEVVDDKIAYFARSVTTHTT